MHINIGETHTVDLGTLREEPSQINVILQQKLPAAKLSAVCTVYWRLQDATVA